MKNLKVLVNGSNRVITSENKTIMVLKDDCVVLVKDLGTKALVQYLNDDNFIIPLGSFEMSKEDLVLV